VGLNIVAAALHDAAVRVGEVALCLGLGSCLSVRGSLGLQGGSGLTNLLDAPLLVGHPVRQLIPAPIGVLAILGRVGRCRLIKPAAYLLAQPPLALGHAPIAHGLVLVGVGLDLR